MGCPPTVLTCVVVPPPAETSWWLTMLQIFVPVATALLVAVLAYRYGLRADRSARVIEARLEVQRAALANGQQAFADYWASAYKLLRTGNMSNPDLTSKLEQTSIQVMVAYSQLQDRDLAEKISTWQHNIALLTAQATSTRTPMGQDELNRHYQEFVTLCNQLGSSLREVSSVPVEPNRLRWRRLRRRAGAKPLGRSVRGNDGRLTGRSCTARGHGLGSGACGDRPRLSNYCVPHEQC